MWPVPPISIRIPLYVSHEKLLIRRQLNGFIWNYSTAARNLTNVFVDTILWHTVKLGFHKKVDCLWLQSTALVTVAYKNKSSPLRRDWQRNGTTHQELVAMAKKASHVRANGSASKL